MCAVNAQEIVDNLLESSSKGDEDTTPWVGVDLDGTLARYTDWKGKYHVGAPIPKMVRRVKRWLSQGKKVKVLTARAADKASVPAVKRWLRQHGMEGVEVTNEKDPYMTRLWDDKAVAVQTNTGDRK